jgi:hypothetical protein
LIDKRGNLDSSEAMKEVTVMPKRKLPKEVVALHLEDVFEKAGYPSYYNPKEPLNLYGQIKNGVKLSEWRAFKPYWLRILCKEAGKVQKEIEKLTKSHKQHGRGLLPPIDLTNKLKVHKAWFFEGYPKDELATLPHLEAEIIGLWYHPEKNTLEIKIANVAEVNS